MVIFRGLSDRDKQCILDVVGVCVVALAVLVVFLAIQF